MPSDERESKRDGGDPSQDTTSRALLVVFVVAIIMASASGAGFYGSTIYIASLVSSPISYSVTMVSLATGAFMLASGFGGLGVAWAMDRSSPRAVMVAGALTMAVALLALGRVRGDLPLILVYTVIGIGFAGVTVVPAGRLIAAWFVEKRTLAMATAFMGLPLGGMVITPIVSYLVENRGFVETTVWLAIGLVSLVLPLSVIAREPKQLHHPKALPDLPLVTDSGFGYEEADEDQPSSSDWVPAAIAIRTRWFVVATIALSLAMITQIGALTHMYNAVSQVQDFATGAAVISTITFASLGGRIIGSWGLEKIGLQRSTVLLLATQSLSLIAIVLWRDGNLIYPAAIAFGLTLGNLQVIQPLLLVERFGSVDFADILAVGNLFLTFGMAVGPLVVGFAVDQGAGYAIGLLLLACISAIATMLMFVASRFGGPTIKARA